MSKLNERIRQIDNAIPDAGVQVKGLSPELIELSRELCEHFEVGYGTLLRRATAIAAFDKSKSGISRVHLQEAAQHLVVKSQEKS